MSQSHVSAGVAVGAAYPAGHRSAVEHAGGQVDLTLTQRADFLSAVYGNAWWVISLTVIVPAPRASVPPIKALLLNVFSIGAGYDVTVLVWQHSIDTRLLFNQAAWGQEQHLGADRGIRVPARAIHGLRSIPALRHDAW